MAVTIKLLEVRIEVEGNDAEREFARLFNDHIVRWQRRVNEDCERERLAERERELGDREELRS
jgi:hypothetical protein